MEKKELFKAYFALIIVCLVWGTTYLALRVGVQSYPPFLFSGIRQTLAGTILISWIFLTTRTLPTINDIKKNIFIGFAMITLGNGLVSWAEMFIPSGLTALICSLLPIWMIVINLVYRSNEKINFKILTGILLGLVGLLIIFNDNLIDFTNPNYIAGIIAIFIANFFWALGTIAIKRGNNANPFLAAGIQVFSGGIFMLIYSLFFENFTPLHYDLNAIVSLIYLTIFGSVITYGAFIYSLSKLPATIASLYSYINPIVAIIFGWILLNEKLNWVMSAACLIIVIGVYLVNDGAIKNKK